MLAKLYTLRRRTIPGLIRWLDSLRRLFSLFHSSLVPGAGLNTLLERCDGDITYT